MQGRDKEVRERELQCVDLEIEKENTNVGLGFYVVMKETNIKVGWLAC